MRSFANFLLICWFTLSASLTAQTSQPADIGQSAQTAIERLEKGEYSAAAAMFSARLRKKFELVFNADGKIAGLLLHRK